MDQVGTKMLTCAVSIFFLLGSFKGLHCFQPRGSPASLSRRLSAITSLIIYPNDSSLTARRTAPALLHDGLTQTEVRI